MTERLTAAEEATWYPFAKLITRLPGALDSLLDREAGLTYVEFYVLDHLARGPARMTAIAETATLSPSRLSHVSRRLEHAGLIERRPDPDDRRGTLASISTKGRALLEHAAVVHWTQVRTALLDQLTPADAATLQRVSTALLAALDS